jgi:predicted RecA/RadA family phage recombinase
MDLRYSVGVRAVYPLAFWGVVCSVVSRSAVASSGNVVQVMPAGTNLTFVGIALDSYTNAPAGTRVEVVREGVVSLPFTGAPPSNWLGALLYWNGSAYTFTATGNTAVGRVIGVEGNVARVVIQTVV